MPGLLATALVATSATVLAGGAVALDRMALKIVRPPRRPHRRDPEGLDARVEAVTVPGDVPLKAWWLHGDGSTLAGPRPVVILAHGWGANAAVMLDLAAPLVAAGHDVVVFDVRNHGRSGEAPWVTLGQFVRDTRRIVEHVRTRAPGRPIVLGGHSMGGAAAVIAAADDAHISRVVLVAAPHDMYGTLSRYLAERGMPGVAMVRLLRPFWRPRLGRSHTELDPGLRAREVKVPVLVIQPELDLRVPPENGRELARDTGGRLMMVEAADHNDVLQRTEVHAAIDEFVGAATA